MGFWAGLEIPGANGRAAHLYVDCKLCIVKALRHRPLVGRVRCYFFAAAGVFLFDSDIRAGRLRRFVIRLEKGLGVE